MDAVELHQALVLLADKLSMAVPDTVIDIYVAGGSAGMLSGVLASDRTTRDCDVLEVNPVDSMAKIRLASGDVARSLQLADDWLNTDVQMFAWYLPIGWKGRCEMRTFGCLRVHLLSRIDLMAIKSVACNVRPADLEDIQAMQPSTEDIAFAIANLKRIESEHPGRDTFEVQIAMLESLRGDE